MSDFKKFYDKKIEELNGQSLTFKAQASMGTHPLTTRQPANFHFYLAVLEQLIPDVSRGEILFEAIQSAYRDIAISDDLTPPVQARVDSVRGMLLNAYHGKCSKLDSEMAQGETGFSANEATKKICDDFIADYTENGLSFDELIAKYRDTFLGDCIHETVLESVK